MVPAHLGRGGHRRAARLRRPRPTATAVYFLLGPGGTSRWHAVRSAELWCWHRGGPLTLQLDTGHPPRLGLGARQQPRTDTRHLLGPDLAAGGQPHPGTGTSHVLGPDLAAGQQPQLLVPADCWQRALAGPDAETLVTCVVSPGFDFADFRLC